MQFHAHARAGSGRAGAPVASLLVLLATALTAPAAVLAAPKTDVVVLVNGDRITGEIKSLEYNRLKYSTSHMGTIYIEWDKIARLKTDQYVLLERTDGSRYYGQLDFAGEDRQINVRRSPESRPEPLDMTTVVRAQPIDRGDFVDRLDGYVSAGVDYAKASNRGSLDLAGGLSSRTRVRRWSVDGTVSLVEDSGNDETDERWDLRGSWRRFLRQRYFWEGFGGLERNSELDLNLRTTAGGGMGRFLLQTNFAEWVVGAGLAYSHENYTGGEVFNSLEAALTTQFAIFRYDFPETDITGTLTVLPSLTKSGRYRSQADLRAKYEFVDDLYFELRLYGSYDSRPPTEDVEKSDYGFTTSLGYSF